MHALSQATSYPTAETRQRRGNVQPNEKTKMNTEPSYQSGRRHSTSLHANVHKQVPKGTELRKRKLNASKRQSDKQTR
ncbi:hypothetical protein AOLI_G00215590 [Acnodon oligacanthus]